MGPRRVALGWMADDSEARPMANHHAPSCVMLGMQENDAASSSLLMLGSVSPHGEWMIVSERSDHGMDEAVHDCAPTVLCNVRHMFHFVFVSP